jgi:hypothetical protein
MLNPPAKTGNLVRFLGPLLVIPLVITACSSQQTSESQLTARDIFYHADPGKTSNASSSGSGSNALGGTSCAYSLELRRGDADPVACDNRFTFKSGDAIRLHLKVNQPLYAYVIEIGSNGESNKIFPASGDDNHLEPGKVCTVPQEGDMVFDDNAGSETLLIGLTQEPVDEKKALQSKGTPIDAAALNGQPTTVGDYSVLSGFGSTYELGKPPQGEGLVYVSTAKREQAIIIALRLKHSKNGEAANEGTASSDNNFDKLQSQLAAAQGTPHCYGIIPPFMLEDIAKRNPESRSLRDTIVEMRSLELHPPAPASRDAGDGHGAREVYDAKETQNMPGEKVRFEGESPAGKFEADQIFDLTGQVRDFYQECFNRNSIDGKGMKLIASENFGKNFENACWTGSQMLYGVPGPDSPFGTFVLLDVIGHEMTHGVTQLEQPLEYHGQSGALNESLSDVFGELVRQKAEGTTADQADWVLAKGIWKNGVHGDGLRNMLHPGTAYDDPRTGKDPQPDNMSNYVKTTGDGGGVHINSGIPNRAFALFAIDVGGNAWEKPAKIWFAARQESPTKASFAQFAYHTIEAAKKLGYDEEVQKLEKAWSDVGVTPNKDETDTLTP